MICSDAETGNSLRLELFTPTFVGGDVVTGNVHVDLRTPFIARGIVAGISGSESWTSSSSSSSQQQQQHSSEIFRRLEKVYVFEGIFPPGRACFPFRFELPPRIPGVFASSAAKVAYKVVAFIDGVVGGPKLRASARIVVNERFDDAPAPPVERASQQISSKCALEAKAALSAAALFPGERLTVRLKVNSTLKLPTGPASVALVHDLVLRSPAAADAPPATTPPLPPPFGKISGGSFGAQDSAATTLPVHHQHPSPSASSSSAAKDETRIRTELIRKDLPPFAAAWLGVREIAFNLPASPSVLPPTSISGRLVHSTYTVIVTLGISSAATTAPTAADAPAAASHAGQTSSLLTMRLPLVVLAPQYMYSSPQHTTAAAAAASVLKVEVSETPYRVPWQPDAEALSCNGCGAKFVMLWQRRHHCRNCGKVFCAACTKRSPIINIGYSLPVRVCNACFPIAQAGGVLLKPKRSSATEPQAASSDVDMS